MKGKLVFAAVVALLFVLAPQVFAQYNRDLTVTVMRNNVKLVGELNAAAKAQDYYSAAVKLMAIAEGHKSLLNISPPKGSKAEWDRLHTDLINAAFRGIGACGSANAEALQKEIGGIMALNKQGHSTFK